MEVAAANATLEEERLVSDTFAMFKVSKSRGTSNKFISE